MKPTNQSRNSKYHRGKKSAVSTSIESCGEKGIATAF
jgi:hypothetical protein